MSSLFKPFKIPCPESFIRSLAAILPSLLSLDFSALPMVLEKTLYYIDSKLALNSEVTLPAGFLRLILFA